MTPVTKQALSAPHTKVQRQTDSALTMALLGTCQSLSYGPPNSLQTRLLSQLYGLSGGLLDDADTRLGEAKVTSVVKPLDMSSNVSKHTCAGSGVFV